MKNLLIDSLVKDLSQISSMHDNCLDDIIKLYENEEYQYPVLEQTIQKSITFEKKNDNITIELEQEDTNEIFFREEYDNHYELPGTINQLLIEKAQDIEI